ncbi:MAG: hypothetical protein CMF48_00785 [Legionellales bacterium]|nr:hypothetical protein [Legionellales bacterium]|tara:strand:- start:312 stop:1148 length:837 start_codon:yes stop_codon:yes gene_type:complete
MTFTVFDSHKTRLRLKKQTEGLPYNWLFIPGGPGVDSQYFDELIEICDLPGNAWEVDFFENGSNTKTPGAFDPSYNFDSWRDALVDLVSALDNVILVGHSFGGFYPLMHPDVEAHLTGYIILNSIPSPWIEKAVEKAASRQLPSFAKEMADFEANPNPQTFSDALQACIPYYFPPKTLDKGKALLADLPFNYYAAGWGQTIAIENKDFANWIPSQMPVMIIGASEDCVTPFEIFQNDDRFKKDNIQLFEIKDAGHFPWVEKPEEIKSLFRQYIARVEA